MRDYHGKLTVGNNQNSYNFDPIYSSNNKLINRGYINANLPFYYSVESKAGNTVLKPTLTYFITILYDKEKLDILNISIFSMPNGLLYPVYGSDIIGAGKQNYDSKHPFKGRYLRTIRYHWENARKFYTLDYPRYYSVYFNQELLSDLALRKKELFKDQIVRELKFLLTPQPISFIK